MDSLLEMAGKAGMDKPQSEAAAGGILSFLKKNLKEDQFNTILEKVPGAKDFVTKQEEEEVASRDSGSGGGGGMGGLLGSAMSSLGGSSGGGGGSGGGSSALDMAGLMSTLSSKGVDPSMMSKYLPMVSTFLQEKCGVDVSSVLGVPGGGAAGSSEGSGSAGGGSSSGGAMGSLTGMASSFLKK